MKVILIAFILLATLANVGCERSYTEPPAYRVGYDNGLPIGAFSPDLPLVTPEGKQTLSARVAGGVMVVVFLAPTGSECCEIAPELVEMAERFQHEYVSVVQVSLPTSECPHGPGCVEVCSMFDKHLILLCDKDNIAWRGYGRPEPGTVFLVDDDNRIVAIESLENLVTIEKQARKLSDKVREEHEEALQG